jgi:AhpD family alkylhydroperoxidase
LNKGEFTPKEREAVSLIVSEINACAYCLAGHTVAAIRRGFSKEETLDIRRGKVTDPKLNAIIQLAASMSENKGHADESVLNAFYEAGFNEGALMELVGLVSLRIFTNYAFALTQIPVDFPLADPIN